MDKSRKLFWVTSKILITYYLYYKPIQYHGIKYIYNLILISISSGIINWVLNFLNHHYEETPFHDPKECWQKEVVTKSVNWNSNDLINFLSFGINKHVEHHLFPTISSCNLKYITPEIKKIFNIKEKNLSQAVKEHLSYLVKRGNCN